MFPPGLMQKSWLWWLWRLERVLLTRRTGNILAKYLHLCDIWNDDMRGSSLAMTSAYAGLASAFILYNIASPRSKTFFLKQNSTPQMHSHSLTTQVWHDILIPLNTTPFDVMVTQLCLKSRRTSDVYRDPLPGSRKNRKNV